MGEGTVRLMCADNASRLHRRRDLAGRLMCAVLCFALLCCALVQQVAAASVSGRAGVAVIGQ